MDNKKFEQLIDLVINENEEKARELFHEIIVEKSREIYESIMEEEMMDETVHSDEMEEGMGGQVGDMIDEISAEEEGMMEEEEGEEEIEMASDEHTMDLGDMEDMGDDADGDEVEDAVIRIEDKLDQLMAEFESIMGGDADMDADMGDADMGGDEESEVDVDSEESEEEVMEAVQLQKVTVTHGDNGSQTKSPVAANAGQAGMASKPVKASTTTENGRTAPTAKDVDGASKFKNAPGQKKAPDLAAAPKPETKQASGVNTKSPVAKK